MANKLTNEQGQRISALQQEIEQLHDQVTEKEFEIEKIIMESGGDFEGSYVEFYDGDEYVFMKVERQIIRNEGRTINLQGPAIKLCDTPLQEEDDDDDGIDIGSYDESYGFSFGSRTLQDLCVQTIRKITKKEMSIVLDYYINTMKKNLL